MVLLFLRPVNSLNKHLVEFWNCLLFKTDISVERVVVIDFFVNFLYAQLQLFFDLVR